MVLTSLLLQDDMNLTEEKKAPLRQMTVDRKRAMLSMQYKGAIQVSKAIVPQSVNLSV